MKTTLDLPDDVLTLAKIYAAQNRTTLKDVVTEGLRRVITSPAPDAATEQRARAERLIASLQTLGLGQDGPIQPLTREEIYDRQALR